MESECASGSTSSSYADFAADCVVRASSVQRRRPGSARRHPRSEVPSNAVRASPLSRRLQRLGCGSRFSRPPLPSPAAEDASPGTGRGDSRGCVLGGAEGCSVEAGDERWVTGKVSSKGGCGGLAGFCARLSRYNMRLKCAFVLRRHSAASVAACPPRMAVRRGTPQLRACACACV